MSLYLVTDGERKLWVAYEDEVKAQMYVWVPNTGLWHRNKGVSADYYWDQTGTYQPIDAADARVLMSEGVGKLDGQTKASQLARFRDDPAALDTADVLGDGPTTRPASDRR